MHMFKHRLVDPRLEDLCSNHRSSLEEIYVQIIDPRWRSMSKSKILVGKIYCQIEYLSSNQIDHYHSPSVSEVLNSVHN